MAKTKLKAALDFFDGKVAGVVIPPGFFTAGQWSLKLQATDVKYVRQQLRFMTQDRLADELVIMRGRQKISLFKLLPLKRCAHCRGVIGASPRKLFTNEYTGPNQRTV
jgi:hypothetical protein